MNSDKPPATPYELIWRAGEIIKRFGWSRTQPGGITLNRALDRAADPDGNAPLQPEHHALIAAAEDILTRHLGDLRVWEYDTADTPPSRIAFRLQFLAVIHLDDDLVGV